MIQSHSIQPNPEDPTPEPPSVSTGVRTLRLTDFEQAYSLFANWQGRFDQLSIGRFGGSLRIVRGRTVRLMAIDSNQRILLHGRDASGLISVYPVTAENAGSLWHGRRLEPGQFVFHGTNTETDHYSARQTDHVGISLLPEMIEEAARSLLNSDTVSLPRDWAVFSPPPESLAGFNGHFARLMGRAVADPSILRSPEGHRMEQDSVRSLVASMFSLSHPRPQVSLPGRSRLIRRAEEFMRARLAISLGAIDLCRELGASDRTLRLAFRERYGIGPMAYYRTLRLNAVRSRLKASSSVAIAEVAREFGFHHLGNFAADYRRLFGERPSATSR